MRGRGASDIELLLFDLEGRTFGLPSDDVIEIVRACAVSPLPAGPRVVSGVINLRGRIVPLFDVRVRFGMSSPPLEPSDHFIVAHAGERVVALRADRARALVRMAAGDIEDAERVVSGTRYIAGIAKTDGGIVFLHDLDGFLSESEGDTLDHAMSAVSA
jgi:purine-binding chemotaxis protein CheW